MSNSYEGKWHITGQGVPAPCPAKIQCRLGGDSGFENHFDSKEEALDESQRQMMSEYGETASLTKTPEPAPEPEYQYEPNTYYDEYDDFQEFEDLNLKWNYDVHWGVENSALYMKMQDDIKVAQENGFISRHATVNLDYDDSPGYSDEERITATITYADQEDRNIYYYDHDYDGTVERHLRPPFNRDLEYVETIQQSYNEGDGPSRFVGTTHVETDTDEESRRYEFAAIQEAYNDAGISGFDEFRFSYNDIDERARRMRFDEGAF